MAPADDYVAEFVRHMNPLDVLTGSMIMQQRAHMSGDGAAVWLDARPTLPAILEFAGTKRWICGSTAYRTASVTCAMAALPAPGPESPSPPPPCPCMRSSACARSPVIRCCWPRMAGF